MSGLWALLQRQDQRSILGALMKITVNLGTTISGLIHMLIGYIWLGLPGLGLAALCQISLNTKDRVFYI